MADEAKYLVDRGMRKLEEGKDPSRGPQPPPPRGMRATTVKNKAPAAIQITAEQILREAHEYKEEEISAPRTKITSVDELEEYRARKRKEFEDVARRSRQNIGNWVKYAQWEAKQKEFDRARSVWERTLDVDYRNVSVWLKYIDMEMKNRFINHARNLYDRVVSLLPRIDQFWYKYALMEEMLENVAGARQIFERWMQWMPDHMAWQRYIKLEIRYKNVDKARAIYDRYVKCHPEVDTYLKYAKFEARYGTKDHARKVFARALEELPEEEATSENLFLTFAKFEQDSKEFERARVIYKYAIDHVPKHKAESLFAKYASFEKQFGDRNGIEEVTLSRRRFQYEEDLKTNPRDYDTWIDYIRLEEARGDVPRVREVYERAISQLPPVAEKRLWQRYIYLWISFALYEELEAKDFDRARQVYKKALEIVPHKQFTFSKLWILAAQFEVRQKDLDAARRILGSAIGQCPREKIFREYIEMELQLGNIDRCRKLYEKYLEFAPENCQAWAKYAELEASLQETERARAIFELAVNQPSLDMPEVLWKAYIDFEIKNNEIDKTRELYKRLLRRTKHVKVWISRAQFEASIKAPERARAVFEEAEQYMKEQEAKKEERVLLLESWLDFERNFGTAETVKKTTDRMPQKVKKRREVVAEDGTPLGFEDYIDYIFPEDKAKQASLKILEIARAWKKQKTAGAS